MGKKSIMILILITALLMTSCRDVDDMKEKLTKPYVDTIINATNETKTNLAENNIDTANKPASNPTPPEEKTVIEEPKTTMTSSDYKVTTNQQFYLPKDEIKIRLELKKEAYLKITQTQRKFDLYRLEDGEFKKIMVNEPDDCYYNDCDSEELNMICPKKDYECKRYTKNFEEDFMPYVWKSMIIDCGETSDAEILKEELLGEGIYKIEYRLYQSSDCSQGLAVSTVFAIKE